jgi:hypothetical protein
MDRVREIYGGREGGREGVRERWSQGERESGRDRECPK